MLAELRQNPALKRGIKAAGWLVLLAAAAYLVYEIGKLDFGGLVAQLSVSAWLIAGFASAGYGAALTLLAIGWLALADRTQRPDILQAMTIYAPGVIAKYLPGSVFQYASRQVLGAQHGLAQSNMAKGSLIEALLHPVAAILVAALLAIWGLWGAIAVAAIGLLLAVLRPEPLIIAVGLQVAFFGCFGALVTVVAGAATDFANPALFGAFYLVAWLAGFLVPIAPGGLGVREAALLSLAGAVFGAGPTALLAVLIRLVTLCGDALFGLAGYGAAVSVRSNKQASA